MSEEYNGWANYETWLVNEWNYVDLMIETAKENEHPADAVWCQEFFEQLVAEYVPRHVGAVSFLYWSALERIDWCEIAEHVNDNLSAKS